MCWQNLWPAAIYICTRQVFEMVPRNLHEPWQWLKLNDAVYLRTVTHVLVTSIPDKKKYRSPPGGLMQRSQHHPLVAFVMKKGYIYIITWSCNLWQPQMNFVLLVPVCKVVLYCPTHKGQYCLVFLLPGPSYGHAGSSRVWGWSVLPKGMASVAHSCPGIWTHNLQLAGSALAHPTLGLISKRINTYN